jgi:hypothetical protein
MGVVEPEAVFGDGGWVEFRSRYWNNTQRQ